MKIVARILLLTALAMASTYADATSSDFLIILGKTSSASGGGGLGCTNQFVLDYSNSCALIGQAFGE